MQTGISYAHMRQDSNGQRRQTEKGALMQDIQALKSTCFACIHPLVACMLWTYRH